MHVSTFSFVSNKVDHVLLACVMLGELDETNQDCLITLDDQCPDQTTNIKAPGHTVEERKDLLETVYNST